MPVGGWCTLLTPPPLSTGVLYSPQFRSHQETKIAATGLNKVCACAKSHGSRWRQRPGHHIKLRKNGGVKKFRMVPGLW